jgi:hypothetical protein
MSPVRRCGPGVVDERLGTTPTACPSDELCAPEDGPAAMTAPNPPESTASVRRGQITRAAGLPKPPAGRPQ